MKDAADNPVAGTVSYDWEASTATLQPAADLVPAQQYTATVSAKDLAGNAMGASSWSFTPVGPPCPCSVFSPTAVPATPASSDPAAVEVGMKFRADQNGLVSGVRFYKGAANTGTHTGHLWTAAGALLGTVTFTGESASGWQQAIFDTPVAVVAGTTYVVSYHSTTGRYAVNAGYFTSTTTSAPVRGLGDGVDGPNGVFKYGGSPGFPNGNGNKSNYWVDVVFAPVP